MVIEGMRILVDALESPVYGVNEQLERVPKDVADPQPAAVMSVLELTSNPEVLGIVENGIGGIAWPALVVAPEEPVVYSGELEGAAIRRDGESVGYSVTYVTREADIAAACRDGLYTMRAIEQTIAHLMKGANEADRTRNGIVLQYCIEIVYGLLNVQIDDGTIAAGLSVSFQPRNLNPLPS